MFLQFIKRASVAFVFAVFVIAVVPSISTRHSELSLSPNLALAFGTSGNGGCCGGNTGGAGFVGGEGDRPVTPPTPPTPPTPKPLPVCNVTVSPSSVVRGGTSILSWTSSNATSGIMNNGVGAVTTSGSRVLNNIQNSSTYILNVSGAGGGATCSAPLVVTIPPQVPTCSLYANTTTVRKGNPVTLSWNSSFADTATLTTIGNVAMSGSRVVYPNTTRNYVLYVTGTGGTRTCTTQVNVNTPPVVYRNAPSCTLSVDNTSIAQGSQTVLRWSTYNTSSAYLNKFGAVGTYGSRAVAPSRRTQYYMTVRNIYGDTAYCNVALDVYTPYVPPVITTQYIPISSVPYTGTDDIPYVLGLLGIFLAASGGAYIVYRKQFRRRS